MLVESRMRGNVHVRFGGRKRGNGAGVTRPPRLLPTQHVPLAEIGAEFLFQVIAERAEKAAVVVTTNLPFSEWTTVIPNARLCKALIDRITDRANIIETGTESYRFRRTLEKRKGKTPDAKS
jgi:hypothetical protein